MKTTVVNLRRNKYDVYIGRGRNSHFGNPFSVQQYGRDGCIEKYREYFLGKIERDEIFRERVLELKGKILGCFCKPRSCHGDVIAEWLNSQEGK